MINKQCLSVFGIFKQKPGFSLIEIVVAMLIIGIMATLTIPGFLSRGASPVDKFIIQLNNLAQTALSQAYETNKIQKIMFDFQSNNVILDKNNAIDIPESLEFTNLSIAGKPEYTSGQAYFYISPEGLSQEVSLDIINTQNQITQAAILNPFSVQFRLL